MLLVDHMNFCDLTEGDADVASVFKDINGWASFADKASEYINLFRETYTKGFKKHVIVGGKTNAVQISSVYSEKEIKTYRKQQILKVGDEVVMNLNPRYSEKTGNPDASGFNKRVECNDPQRMKGGANLDGGTLVEGSGGFRTNLWTMGAFSHPFEAQEAMNAIHFEVWTASQLLHTFMVKVLGVVRLLDPKGTPSHFTTCAFCGNDDESAKKMLCSRCLLVAYCGPSCQRSAWKSHKVSCTKKVKALT